MKLKNIYFVMSWILFSQPLFQAKAMAAKPSIKSTEIVMPAPTIENQIATERTAKRLVSSHYRKINLNDEFSLKILNRYLNSIDYNHNIFLQKDIDNIRAKYGKKLDNDLLNGNLKSAFEIYQLMAKRRYERYSYALSLLEKEPNLNDKEQIEIDREKAPWPKNIQEANRLWRERVENDVINQNLKDKTWSEIQEKLTKRYNYAIKHLTQVRSDDITQTFLNAFAREIDPHTSYLAPRSAKDFNENITLSMEGIGAVLSQEDDETVIRELIKGAPAERSKQIKAGDKIIGVGQKAKEIEDVVGWRLTDVVDKIKGKKGTKVYLEIEPEKGGKSKIVMLERDTVRIEEQEAKLTINEVRGKKIAHLKISTFYFGLTRDVRDLLNGKTLRKDDSLGVQKQQNTKPLDADALIIDLRDNSGGSLSEVVELSGLFISDGPIVQVRDAAKRLHVYDDPDRNLVYSAPIFVMINRSSASASEIFAAAIQDYKRGIILGQVSFGKGTVQQSRQLRNKLHDEQENIKDVGILQYTIQKFYRINGGSNQIKGVMPDITFPEIIDSKEYGEGKEDNALPWDSIPAAFYVQYPSTKHLWDKLKNNHQQRMSVEPEFIALNEDIKEQKRLNERKYLSLQFKVRKQEDEKYDARKLKKLNARFKREGKPELKKLDDLPKDYEAPDFFLREAEQIGVDLLELSAKK